ncbi:MAG: DUF805 domain-containing protein [Acetobacteraceae bacterium]
MSKWVFCRDCGAEIHESAPFCLKCRAPQRPGFAAGADDQKPRTFTNSITISLNRYVQFSGRAPRAELWYFVLFVFLIALGANVIDAIWLRYHFKLFVAIVDLAFFLPNLAVQVRRLHDLGRTGWWLLLLFVPLVGAIVLLVWFCTRGTRGKNRFGVDPLAAYPT